MTSAVGERFLPVGVGHVSGVSRNLCNKPLFSEVFLDEGDIWIPV